MKNYWLLWLQHDFRKSFFWKIAITFFFNLFFYWKIIALQNFVVFCSTSTWISHRYTYIPSLLNLPSPSPSHPSRLIQSPCLSFLSHTANSCFVKHFLIILKWLMALLEKKKVCWKWPLVNWCIIPSTVKRQQNWPPPGVLEGAKCLQTVSQSPVTQIYGWQRW